MSTLRKSPSSPNLGRTSFNPLDSLAIKISPRSRKARPGTSSFTLIELLIVIAILVILAVVVILTLNPAELLAQSRDSGRLSDMASLNSAINIYLVDSGGTGSLGNSTSVYVSVPDASSTCGDLGLPALPTGYGYHCVASTSTHNTDGTGWIPVKLASTSSGTPLGSLPIDPTNTTSSGLYYTYVTDGAGNYELTMVPESQKYASTAASDGGVDPAMYEAGNKLTLSPFVHGLVGYWPMNEGSGNYALDYSGFNNSITERISTTTTGSLSTSTGCLLSNCVYFNGTTNYIISTTTALYGLGASSGSIFKPFTVAGWFNWQSKNAQEWNQIFTFGSNASLYSGVWNNYLDSGSEFNDGGVPSWYYNPPEYQHNMIDGNWHFYAYVYNVSSLSLYVDGKLSGTVAVPRLQLINQLNLFVLGAIGNPPSGWFFNGLMNNFRIYNGVALTTSQIQAIYNAKQ